MRHRKHHKVGKESVYYHPVLDAPMPLLVFASRVTGIFPQLFRQMMRMIIRLLKPSTAKFLRRFWLLLCIEGSLISWNALFYLAGKWSPVERSTIDFLVVVEILLALPAAYLLNRIIDWRVKDKKLRDQLPLFLDIIFFTVNPIRLIYIWVFRPCVIGVCRLLYGRWCEPRWLD